MSTMQEITDRPAAAVDVPESKTVPESPNKSTDSTDSLKENQPENRNLETGHVGIIPLGELKTFSKPFNCDETRNNLSSDDESFTDCASFSSPLGTRLPPQMDCDPLVDSLASFMGQISLDKTFVEEKLVLPHDKSGPFDEIGESSGKISGQSKSIAASTQENTEPFDYSSVPLPDEDDTPSSLNDGYAQDEGEPMSIDETVIMTPEDKGIVQDTTNTTVFKNHDEEKDYFNKEELSVVGFKPNEVEPIPAEEAITNTSSSEEDLSPVTVVIDLKPISITEFTKIIGELTSAEETIVHKSLPEDLTRVITNNIITGEECLDSVAVMIDQKDEESLSNDKEISVTGLTPAEDESILAEEAIINKRLSEGMIRDVTKNIFADEYLDPVAVIIDQKDEEPHLNDGGVSATALKQTEGEPIPAEETIIHESLSEDMTRAITKNIITGEEYFDSVPVIIDQKDEEPLLNGENVTGLTLTEEIQAEKAIINKTVLLDQTVNTVLHEDYLKPINVEDSSDAGLNNHGIIMDEPMDIQVEAAVSADKSNLNKSVVDHDLVSTISSTTKTENRVSIECPVANASNEESPIETQPRVVEKKCRSIEVPTIENEFKMPTITSRQSLTSSKVNPFEGAGMEPNNTEIAKQELFISSKDFDFLLNKQPGSSSTCFESRIKDSVLLKFDPLINQPVIVERYSGLAPNATEIDFLTKCDGKGNSLVNEDLVPDESINNKSQAREDSFLEVFGVRKCDPERDVAIAEKDETRANNNCPEIKLVDVTMSLDIINDSNLSSANTTTTTTTLNHFNDDHLGATKLRMSTENHNNNHEKMERGSLNEGLERKLKELEEKEEVLLKRITEKDKQITKMSTIVEEYERSIAGLLKERATNKDLFEKRCSSLEAERDSNFQHLSSLESTFSDLHAKYERSKQMIESLKKSEESLLLDKKQAAEQAASQEARYEKLKSHAMTQMDIANTRLREETTVYNHEVSRLKALLKKEEITRGSLQEQLNQKTRENEELIKIWDELKTDGSR